MKVNRKAQSYGLFGFIFSLLFFIVVWFVWLGGWLSDVGEFMITTGSLSGIEALICANLNIVVMFALLICIVGYAYFKG